MSIDTLKKIIEGVDERLYEMLFDLSASASPSRYFPFPAHFRTTEGKEIIPGIESYSDEDHKNMMCVHKKVPATKADAVKALTESKLDSDTIQIMLYIFNVKFAMSYYGSTYSADIEEYEYRYDPIVELYRNKKYRERWYLFHGSSPSNWHSILRNGIRNMSHSSLMTAGAAYGPGIYSSDALNVSYAYGTDGSGFASYVAVIELREPYESYRKAANIYVLPDTVSFVPRYLLKVSHRAASANFSGKILSFYSELRKKTMATPTVRKRFQRDLDELYLHYQAFEYALFESKEEEALHATIQHMNIKIYYASYPAEVPIVVVDTKSLDKTIVAALPLMEVENENVLILPCTRGWSPLDTLKKVLDECVEVIVSAIAT